MASQGRNQPVEHTVKVNLAELLKRESTVVSLDSDSKTKAKNETLERESQGCTSVVAYSSIFITMSVWKEVTSYGMKYYNDGVYPLPQTQMVAVTELIKFVVFFSLLLHNGMLQQVKISYWYAIPSIIYAFNNNIYYFALHFSTPPMWNVLIQMRIIFTALTYRILFKREISQTQWVALLLLMIAIATSHLTGGQTLGGRSNISISIALACIGSITSCLGTITMEYLFKNDSKSFLEMQSQLYLFSTIVGFLFYGVEWTKGNTTQEWKGSTSLLAFLISANIILGVVCGATVAMIVKKLDNIVKLYTQALANMLTSIACTFFFPDHFMISFTFLASLLAMFFAIFMYENKSICWKTVFDEWVVQTMQNYPCRAVAVSVVLIAGLSGSFFARYWLWGS